MADLKLSIDTSDVPKALMATQRFERQINQLVNRFASGSITQETYNRGLLQIKRSYETLGLSSQKATSEVRRYAQAQLAAAREIQSAAIAQDNFAAATQRSTRSLGRGQVITQQAGYQIGDFIVQVQSGTNAFVAFGQQATQVAGTLTLLGGKMVLIGTVLGIAIPLMTAIAAAMMRTRQAANEAANGIDTLADRVQRARTELADMTFEVEALRRGFEDFSEFALVQQVEDAQTRVRELVAQIYELEQLGTVTGPNERALEAAREALRLAQEQLETYRRTREEHEGLADSGERWANYLQGVQSAYESILRVAQEAGDAFKLDQAEDAQQLAEKIGEAADELRAAQEEGRRLKEETAEAKRQAELLAAVDIKSGITAAANEAARLASNMAAAQAQAALVRNYAGRELAANGNQPLPDGAVQLGDGTILYAPPEVRSGSGGGGSSQVETIEQVIEARRQQIAQELELARLRGEELRIREIQYELENSYQGEVNESVRATIASTAERIAAEERVLNVLQLQQQTYENVFSTIESSMEEALMSLVDGTRSTSEAFRVMAREIIAELYRVLVVQQIVGSAESGTGIVGAISGIFGRASGGSTMQGQPYLVGEKGPELFIPSRSGTIVNNDLTNKAMGGSAAPVINMTYNFQGGITEADLGRALPLMVEQTKRAVVDTVQRGGSVARVFR